MKTLQKLADQIGGKVVVLKYRSCGMFMKGYAIIDKDKNEILTVEPRFYSNGDKWLYVNHSDKASGVCYLKSLIGLRGLSLSAGFTGYTYTHE